jgi:hypothetical protein
MKQFYIEKLTKICLGDFLGDFSLSLGDFLTKTSGHPDNNGPIPSTSKWILPVASLSIILRFTKYWMIPRS